MGRRVEPGAPSHPVTGFEMSNSPFLAGLAAAAASTASVAIAAGLIAAIAGGPAAVVQPAALPLLLVVFVVALLHVLALGLPVYALLPPARRASIWASLGASFLIGAIPIPLLLLFMSLSSGMVTASSNGVQTWVDGRPTIFFFLEFLPIASVFGAFGIAGGFTFWLVRRDRRQGAAGGRDDGRIE
jgi:hypothetical protein